MACAESDEYRRMYEDEMEYESVHELPALFATRPKINRRGSVTEHIIRAQQEFLRSVKGQNHRIADSNKSDSQLNNSCLFGADISQLDPNEVVVEDTPTVAPEDCGVIEELMEYSPSPARGPHRRKLTRRGSMTELINRAQEFFSTKGGKQPFAKDPICGEPKKTADLQMEQYQASRNQSSHRSPTTRAA